MSVKPINEALADFQEEVDNAQSGSVSDLAALNAINDELIELGTDLGTVQTNATTHLATLTGIISALVTAETITTEFDAVLVSLNANDTALQALEVPDMTDALGDLENNSEGVQDLIVPAVPNGIQYINTVLE